MTRAQADAIAAWHRRGEQIALAWTLAGAVLGVAVVWVLSVVLS